MKNFKTLLTLTAMLAGASSAYAASHAGEPMAIGDAQKETATAAAADIAEDEIRKVDMECNKITIKHGEIKNLDMPRMTMVFKVKDPALLEKTKVGEKIRFKAEKAGGALVVTDIEPAN